MTWRKYPAFFENNEDPVYALGESIKLMANADCAYFMKGWNKARGCIIEHEVCERYGIPIIMEWTTIDLNNIASRYTDNSLKYK